VSVTDFAAVRVTACERAILAILVPGQAAWCHAEVAALEQESWAYTQKNTET